MRCRSDFTKVILNHCGRPLFSSFFHFIALIFILFIPRITHQTLSSIVFFFLSKNNQPDRSETRETCPAAR